MARVPLIKTGTHFYHVTTRSNHKEWFKLPLEEVWKISIASMKKANGTHPAEIAQYVLMRNHYHMLIKTPNLDLDKFMYIFNKTFSDLLRKKSEQINRMFGGRYRWSIIDNDDYLETVYKYIYQNPSKADLVKRCEDYRYSTLWYEQRGLRPEFAIKAVRSITPTLLNLLNEKYDTGKSEGIKKGLQKAKFKEVFSRSY